MYKSSLRSSGNKIGKENSKRSRDEEDVKPVRATIDWEKWVAATATRNYLMADPLLDWLSYHSSALARIKPAYSENILKAVSSKNSASFTGFIMAQGIEFESKVMAMFYLKYSPADIIDIGGAHTTARSFEKAQQTIDAMKQGIPIIYSGVLHNPENQTYGVPDILVRSDWIKKLVNLSPITKEAEKIPAPFLNGPYHYRVIDIKWTTLYLRANGTTLLNSSSFPAYKGQIWIYNRALALAQGYEPTDAYIMGRKWKYTKCGETYKGSSCIDRFGVIDFDGVDKEFIEKTAQAVAWVKDMRENGASWDINTVPFSRPELYPNMSNTHDYPWGPVKEAISADIKEISGLWMCGVKNRLISHSKGIYRWDDMRCTSETLGITGTATARIVDALLRGNHDLSPTKIFPPIIDNNDFGWQSRQDIEFFVDFEYVNDINSDFSKMPFVDSYPVIFMIGVGYFGKYTGEWLYKTFTARDLTRDAEREICEEFSNYVRGEAAFYSVPNPLLTHWANAESWQWTGAYDRHDGIERLWIPSAADATHVDPRWFDLLSVFRKEPIIVKGCLGFGLKTIARTMADNGLIESKWDASSGCTDGASAMLNAFNACTEAKRRGLSMELMPQIRDIAKYNEVDCKVLGEIITYLRKHHTA
jgi:hypothetical protein